MSALPSGEPERTPTLTSAIAVIVAFLAAITTTVMGAEYWLERGEPLKVMVTFVAEIIALFGLRLASHQSHGGNRFASVVAVVLTLMCAALCGGVTWAKLDADNRQRAAATHHASPQFVEANSALMSASEALHLELARTPPDCICPATLAAWGNARAAAIEQLAAMRDEAAARLAPAVPASGVRLWDVACAVVLEAIKLFGLFAFGVRREPGGAQNFPHAHQPTPKRGEHVRPLIAAALGILGVGAQPVHAQETHLGQFAVHNDAPEGAQSERPAHNRATRRSARIALIAQARAWRTAGISQVEIARRLGVHRNTVGNWLRL